MLPFFPPVCRIRTRCLFRERRLDHSPIDALPLPDDPLHLIVLGQTGTPEGEEQDPALSQCRKYLCIELALPNRSLGSDFHWQPVLSTKTIPSNTRRSGIRFRPPPAFSLNILPGSLSLSGMKGSTRFQNSSETSHERVFAIPTSWSKCSMAATSSQVNYG